MADYPIEMLLWCPLCHERHIDVDDLKPHKTHACQFCGLLWRPAIQYTKGVQYLEGCKDDRMTHTAKES